MNLRIKFGNFLIKLGNFITSLAVVVMRPEDLIEFSRQTYSKPANVEMWGRKVLINSGLSPEEKEIIRKLPSSSGNLLLLGVGGGREAIPLAKMGFDVTGIDFVYEMIRKAKMNALSHGVQIKGEVQEISTLNMPEEAFDVIWISTSMYSSVPTRKRRVEMLKRIRNSLKHKGYFVCLFQWRKRPVSSPKVDAIRLIIGVLMLGNRWYEPGDQLWGNVEFIHTFVSIEEIKSEFKDSGLDLIHIYLPDEGLMGGAILRKNP